MFLQQEVAGHVQRPRLGLGAGWRHLPDNHVTEVTSADHVATAGQRFERRHRAAVRILHDVEQTTRLRVIAADTSVVPACHAPRHGPALRYKGSVVSLGVGAAGDRPGWHPPGGWHPKEKKFVWANLQRIVEKRGQTGKKGVGWHPGGDDTRVKAIKSDSDSDGDEQKRSPGFQEKNRGVIPSVADPVSPTLVTPLERFSVSDSHQPAPPPHYSRHRLIIIIQGGGLA